MAGTLSKGITLGYKVGEADTFTILTNLQEIPELKNGSTKREHIDTTVLTDDKKQHILGLQEDDEENELAFKFLYEKAQFETLNGITNSVNWEITLPDGLKASFAGSPSLTLDGVGVSAALTYTLNISVEGEITFA